MSNRRKKRPSVREQKVAALASDLEWIFAGARGLGWGLDDYAGADELERVIPAVCETLNIPFRRAAHWIIQNLDKWTSPQTLAEHLVGSESFLSHLRQAEEDTP